MLGLVETLLGGLMQLDAQNPSNDSNYEECKIFSSSGYASALPSVFDAC